MSSVGKWNKQYRQASASAVPYGDSPSYDIGARALADCDTVEDWGCGLGWFKLKLHSLAPHVKYLGVDGSHSPHADIVEDLAGHQTKVDGIFMRHVLEHNYDWPEVLLNAAFSFTKRLVFVTFTPFTNEPMHEELRFEKDYGVPTLSLNHVHLTGLLDGFDVAEETIESPATFYGTETIFTVTR